MLGWRVASGAVVIVRVRMGVSRSSVFVSFKNSKLTNSLFNRKKMIQSTQPADHPTDPQRIRRNLEFVKDRIREACMTHGRDPSEIRLVAVSKHRPDDAILAAREAGQLDFGENRMQDLAGKMSRIDHEDIEWHMIGNIQTNKLRTICQRVDWIHSVDKFKYLEEIERRAGGRDEPVRVLLQVNISREPQKGGLDPEDVEPLLERVASAEWSRLRVSGFMGMASLTADEAVLREQFASLRKLKDRFSHPGSHPATSSIRIEELSMGMSGDLESAIAEGSTIVRVGTAIFG